MSFFKNFCLSYGWVKIDSTEHFFLISPLYSIFLILLEMLTFVIMKFCSASVFGVSAESMQCSYDSKGNSVPTILLLMQERLYSQEGLKV